MKPPVLQVFFWHLIGSICLGVASGHVTTAFGAYGIGLAVIVTINSAATRIIAELRRRK